jgi:hypothetical protein
VSKAHLRANQILRCFLNKDPVTLAKAFVTYVQPLLEYCSIWSPCTVAGIRKVESVEQRFTKNLQGMSALSYDNVWNYSVSIGLIYVVYGVISLLVITFYTVSSNTHTRIALHRKHI